MTGASTVSIVSYSLVHNGTPRTCLSQFDGEEHLLQEHDGPNAPDKSSAVHACDHWTTALGPICYTLSYTLGDYGQYCTQSCDYVEFYGNFINIESPVVTDSLLDLLFLCLSCHANWAPSPVFIIDVLSSVLKSFHPFINSPLTETTVSILNLHSSVDFRRFHTLWPQNTNNASLLFHGASWHWSGQFVRAIAQAHTARSSRPQYGILLRSHFVSRNKIFCFAYFSMHFKIKFLLFNDFPLYFHFVGNDTDILHYILESQQVSLLPKYIRNELPHSCLFGVYFAEFVVCWKFLLGDFIFLCCMQNATFSCYSSVFPSPPLRTRMQFKRVLNSENY